MTRKTRYVVEKETATRSLDSDGGLARAGFRSPERGASPHEEGETNSPAQNPQSSSDVKAILEA
ncbi:hypothetical protein JCGZ_10006 [Jatropha curcas]|uniref:Uncharacterized protein n=1 Tax=Jatropha curcas TaxID=180498 RepID=A0A067KUT0_JATCU|nr:hypothetical protein JCGZ_10006 [Jatropha curcas]